jgi:hypothetical protein
VSERIELRFTGGPHSGLVVEAPADVVQRLPHMTFEVTAAGGLFDVVAQARIRGVRVVARPGEAPPVPPARQVAAVPESATLPSASVPRPKRVPTVGAPQFLPPRR